MPGARAATPRGAPLAAGARLRGRAVHAAGHQHGESGRGRSDVEAWDGLGPADGGGVCQLRRPPGEDEGVAHEGKPTDASDVRDGIVDLRIVESF